MGKRHRLTPELIKTVGDHMKNGVFACTLQSALRIPSSTWYGWIERGEKDLEAGKTSVYAEFSDTINSSKAIAEMYALSKIRGAMDMSWQAAAWYLERVFTNRYGRKDRSEVELSGPNGTPVNPPTIVVNFVKPRGDEGDGDDDDGGAADSG